MTTRTADPILSALRSVPRLLMVWVFGDVVLYALIPIGVITLLGALLGRPSDDLWLLKEWSFANIVFFGTSIRRLLKLKISLQQTPRSYKLDTGVQFFVVMLITATVTLTLIILREWTIVPASADVFLARAHQLLFIMGILATFAATKAEEQAKSAIDTPSPNASRAWLIRRAVDASEQAHDHLNFVATAVRRAAELPSPSSATSAYVQRRLVSQLLANTEGARELIEEGLGRAAQLTATKGP